jgi:multidrug efflux pump subunit AcrA (membrane-fusion protein)
LRHFSNRQTLWTQLEDFTRGVHASLDPRAAAYTIANEGRRLIECDRVSVAIRNGKNCKIEAVSGQDVFDKRSNTVRLLGRLATAVVASGDPLWYTGDTRDLPPQVEDAVQEYVDEAHSKTVAVLPLRRPAPPEEDDKDKRVEPEPPIGALIVEQIEDSRVAASLVQRAEVVARHSSLALANALEHQNLFLMPVWRALGKTRWVLQARTLPKTLSIAGGVLLLLLILTFWPARFTVESKGSLEPLLRQNIYASVDGEVEEIPKGIDNKAFVKKGDLLVKLLNVDLGLRITDIKGQQMAKSQELSAVETEWSKTRTGEERVRLEGKMGELKESVRSLKDQLALYQKEQQDLAVTSPIDGVVITYDLRNRLIHRPVQKGQELLRVADPSGPWQLELHMPENRIGHVVAAQQVKYDASREKLRLLLRDETRAKLGETASEEDVEKAVETTLAGVSDSQLHDRILGFFRQRFDGELQEILKGVTDEPTRAQLGEVLRQPSYEQAQAKLKEILPDMTDGELAARLRSLPNEELDDQLKVTYIIATEPGTTRYGTVTEINRSAEIRGEEGNTVLIKVAIDKSELPSLHPGTSVTGLGVTAKVYCGKRALGFVLFQDVIAFIQSRILFKFF